MIGADRGPITAPIATRMGPRVSLTTELDKRTYQLFSERAKRLNKSKSAYLRQLVEELVSGAHDKL